MTNPLGAGNQPGGWSPAGAFYQVPALPGPYVPFPDPKTGLADTGRPIDPVTRQFVYQTNAQGTSDAQGMGTVEQLVQIAWGTVKIQQKVPVFSTGYQNQVRAIYTSAVSDIIAQSLMSIVSFSLVRIPGTNGIKVVILWRDLTKNIEHKYTPSS